MPYLITMVVHGHGSQMMTTAYIPWIYLFLEKLREKQDLFNFSVFSKFRMGNRLAGTFILCK